MTKGFFRIVTFAVFIFTALGIGALVLFPSPWNTKKTVTEEPPRIIIPRTIGATVGGLHDYADIMLPEDGMSALAPLGDAEVIVAALTGYFDGGPIEKQFIAYRNLMEIESPIYLTFIDYNEQTRSYQRVWNARTAATRPATVRLATQDLLGDRSLCILLSGINSLGEHTLTIFRMNPSRNPGTERFRRIAEFVIDGYITVRETPRSQASLGGPTPGQSLTISTFGRDFQSANILDQIETIYAYNTESGVFEQINTNRIPGSQVEQRRVRELLGNRQVFEDFITGLWYRVTPQGTIDKNQFIYFSPASREIIFYGDGTQQVFSWRNSSATRFGLYINSQNISVASLRRAMDIELESLDSIRIRIIENIRLIRVNSPWDGSYRKAGPFEHQEKTLPLAAHINARYDGPLGRIQFHEDGTFEISTGDSSRQGKYAFLWFNGQETLELRPNGLSYPQRELYLVESDGTGALPRRTLTLHQARIGVRGLERLREIPISLTLMGE
jgi:hypothetical protein